MDKAEARALQAELQDFLTRKMLPFWLERCRDRQYGGFITHFDRNGKDSGEDEKSLIAQSRTLYTMASAHRAGYGEGLCAEFANHGAEFLIEKMWDRKHGGFYWMTDRRGNVTIDAKVLYGLSFAIYSLSEYTLAIGDPIGREYAEKTFDLIQKHCTDTLYGGYMEMFDRAWNLAEPGSQGGDRKTLDVHMHLMEAFTTLYEVSRENLHRRRLLEDIDLLSLRMLHPVHRTGIPQFTPDWHVAPQIKFDIVWGWDRFSEGGQKAQAVDNTSYGHNVEFAWLLLHALDILDMQPGRYESTVRAALAHALRYGIDREFGGVYVEGAHDGPALDLEKEFWQQAEVMIGMLEAYLRFGEQQYWEAYRNVHRFVFDKGLNHEVGEMWPLLSREGDIIWSHISHSWKVN